MTILDRIAGRLGYAKAQPAIGAPIAAAGVASQFTIPDGQLAETQSELYQRLSWVYSAVTIVAETAAGQSFNVKRRQGEKLNDIANHPFELRLARPNPNQSRFELLVATFAYRQLTGNAYWWLNRANEAGEPAEIWVIPSHQIKPVPDGKMFLQGYLYDPGNGADPQMLPPWQIVHFKKFHPRSWFVGLSPIESLAVVAMGDMQAQKWNTNVFGKDNAKLPGALAFADPVTDPIWERMKSDIKAQWGGTNRMGPMLLRNVGKGGVEWITMALSQKDMEFLAGRAFTKEEIFGVFAPGLASMLAINATEANSTAGKATFLEMSVWPALSAVAEKVTNDLLSAYSDDLVGEFDDPRATDRDMELREQETYAKVHTVDEIRAKFYEDSPLGDNRGGLLPAQIGPTTPGPNEPEPVEAQPAPESASPEQRDTGEVAGDASDQDQAKALMLDDLAKWRRKAAKRGGTVDFESDAIPSALSAGIKAGMAQSGLSVWRFLKAQPDARDEAEQALQAALVAALEAHVREITLAIESGGTPDYAAFEATLLTILQPELTIIATEVALRDMATIGVEFDTAMVNLEAIHWARDYSYELVKGLTETTRGVVSYATERWLGTPGMTEGQLEALLVPAFGPVRAEMIAITEVTRAYAEATNLHQGLLKEAGIDMERVWNTSSDERVCPICGPLNGQPEAVWRKLFPKGPPAHTRCRCFVTLRLRKKA